MGEFASRFTGSSDLYEYTSRLPAASVKFVTAHDGFTLHDLVSNHEKQNQANGENNRDGESHNRSWNCGEEGPTTSPEVLALRRQQKRNFFATLLLSQGVPMISGGDEIGRTQLGNNNAYCQDNAISWYNWENAEEELLHYCQRLIHYRSMHPVLHRRRWFHGQAIYGSEVKDIAWFNLEGENMEHEDWSLGHAKTLGVFLNGEHIPNPNLRRDPQIDDSFYIILNAHHEALDFVVPEIEGRDRWNKEVDTAIGWLEGEEHLIAGDVLTLEARSLVLLRCPPRFYIGSFD